MLIGTTGNKECFSSASNILMTGTAIIIFEVLLNRVNITTQKCDRVSTQNTQSPHSIVMHLSSGLDSRSSECSKTKTRGWRRVPPEAS